MPITLDAEATSSPASHILVGSLVSNETLTTSRDVDKTLVEFRQTLQEFLSDVPATESRFSSILDEISRIWSGRIEVIRHTANAGSLREHSYNWRRRLASLREWSGDPAEAEAQQLSDAALVLAERLAAYFESRQITLFGSDPVKPVMSPLASGGVHLEFNIRTGVVHHLEIEISPSAQEPFPILRTIEKRSGEICESRETPHASELELWASLEAFLDSSRRLLR